MARKKALISSKEKYHWGWKDDTKMLDKWAIQKGKD